MVKKLFIEGSRATKVAVVFSESFIVVTVILSLFSFRFAFDLEPTLF